MNWRRTLPGIILLIVILTGCGNSHYKLAMENGEKAVTAGEYAEGIEYFTEALAEKPDDEAATKAIEQTKLMIASRDELRQGELADAIADFEGAASFEGGLAKLSELAEEMLDELREIERLRDENDQDALAYIDRLLEDKGESPWLALYETEFEQVKEAILADLLFAQIKGYAQKEVEAEITDTPLCQINEADILCAYLTIDVTGYRDIVAIHVENEHSLRIETDEERDLLFTNINENSFTLDGDHYQVISKEEADHIVEDLVVYLTLEDILNREHMKELDEVLPGVDYFNQSKDVVEENVAAELEAYSAEEIEYARVWLDYYAQYGGASYPPLKVSYWEEGRPISVPYEEDSAVFKEDVIVLKGDYTADGHVIYSSNGDGTINIYDIPGHWPPDYLLEGGVKAYTTKLANNPERRKIPDGDKVDLLNILETMEIER